MGHYQSVQIELHGPPDQFMGHCVTRISDYAHHNLGPGAVYTGTLVMGMADDGGAVLVMPSDASGTYTASWSCGPCGSTASITVQAYPACNDSVPSTGNAPGIGSVIGLYVRGGAEENPESHPMRNCHGYASDPQGLF